MISFSDYRAQWFGNIRGDLLSGLVVALALIPEAIAFSIIAGVDPKVGLYASFSIAVLIAFVGGRPGKISAATAATAMLMVTLVRDFGLEYLLAATVLAGLIQIGMGLLRLGRFMRFVSKSVMTGFVNALAILIFMAQLPELNFATPGVTWLTWALVAAGLAIIYLFPRLTTAIPSPLVTIILLTALTLVMGWDVRTVGDLGALPDTLPVFLTPDIPLTLETLWIILPYSTAIAIVGLLESLMTQNIVDELTYTKSDRKQECIGQGIANTATGFIGGIAGCAMIGQSIINVKSGGRGRLSAFTAGTVLLILVVGLGDLVGLIPMPALVAIMIMVSIGTFSWSSILNLRAHPRSSSVVMLATVATVVWTHNLAIGVGIGVLLSGIFFAAKIAQLFRIRSTLSDDGRTRTYIAEGQLFYGSAEAFAAAFDFREVVERVIIDVSRAHIWDISSVQALDAAILKFRREGIEVSLIGMNEASETLVDGSAYSESVCHHTAWIAGRLNADVDVMHVLGPREGGAPRDLSGAIGLGARSALLEELARADEQRARLAQAHGRAILEDSEAILRAQNVGTIKVHLRKGDILEAVRPAEPDLRAIVIGKRGEGADFATGHLGSNLERIVRASQVPVFVASRAFRPIGTVLVA